VSARDARLTTADLTEERRAEPERTMDAPAAPMDAQGGPTDTSTAEGEPRDALLPSADGEDYQTRWRQIQERFVDEPRTAVQDADGLVAELMRRMAATFAEEREALETEWERGDEVSTEDLRRAMQHYRSFFNRLLAA
jgi:hypothetical protein